MGLVNGMGMGTLGLLLSSDYSSVRARVCVCRECMGRREEQITYSSVSFEIILVLPLLFTADGRIFDLNAVPRIYFVPSFTLESQKTFSEILPIEDVLGLGESRDQERHDAKKKHKSAPTDKLLHEQVCLCIQPACDLHVTSM